MKEIAMVLCVVALAGVLWASDKPDAATGLTTLTGCVMVATDWADGDSFCVRFPDGREQTVRLYGADCLEWHVNDEPIPEVLTVLNVMSFNIRCAECPDGINAWVNRRDMVYRLFGDEAVHLAGLQEVMAPALRDLAAALPDFGWIGAGRNDGCEAGEFAPIFYRRERFAVEGQGTFWLSPTPGVAGSRGWDAHCPRIATWGRFRDRETGQSLFLMNTHLDHAGSEARRHSVPLLGAGLREKGGELPAIVTGDFNSREGCDAVERLQAETGGRLREARRMAARHEGGDYTYTAFGRETPLRIDYVLVGKEFAVARHGYRQIRNGDVYISDHWPVLVELSNGATGKPAK